MGEVNEYNFVNDPGLFETQSSISTTPPLRSFSTTKANYSAPRPVSTCLHLPVTYMYNADVASIISNRKPRVKAKQSPFDHATLL